MIFFENLHRFKSKILKIRNLKISNKINFGSKKANFFFKKILRNSKFYFEYGSGSSTLQADIFKTRFVSIELDKSYFTLIQKKLKKKSIQYINLGPVGEFSYPLFKNKKRILNYIKSVNSHFKINDYPDFILIDGRFRVACCINLFFLIKKIKAKTTILLDDYEKREHYKILNKFFKIVKVGRMAILYPNYHNNKKNLLDKYIFDSR